MEYSFQLNSLSSCGSHHCAAFQLLHGFEGSRNIALQDLKIARMLSSALERTFTVLSDVQRPVGGIQGTVTGAVKSAVGFKEEDVEPTRIVSIGKR